MNHKHMVTYLAINNLKRKKFRTACLLIVVLILAFTLFAGAVMSSSLENGMNSMQRRLGADLMVVPKGTEEKAEGILIKGEPNYFYFDKNILDRVAQVEGVAQASAQFFLTSVSGGCCSSEVQLIAFDEATDFVIQPWIAQSYSNELQDDQVIVGRNVMLEPDNTIKFFDHSYFVAAQLEKTGTGLDESVFMKADTMDVLINNAKKQSLNFLYDVHPETEISTVLVKVKDGYNARDVMRGIRAEVDEADVIVSENMLSGISSSLTVLVTYIQP